MKTFKQFNEEARENIQEIAPLALIPAALKLGGMALTAYSGASALNNLRKGKFKQAGLDALGAIPGGRVFKGIRALGGAKNLAKAGSALQSASRWNMTGLTPNAYAKGADKVIGTGIKAVTSPFKGNKTNKPNQPGSGAKTSTTKPGEPPKPQPIDYSKFKMTTAKTNLGALKKPKKQTTVKK